MLDQNNVDAPWWLVAVQVVSSVLLVSADETGETENEIKILSVTLSRSSIQQPIFVQSVTLMIVFVVD